MANIRQRVASSGVLGRWTAMLGLVLLVSVAAVDGLRPALAKPAPPLTISWQWSALPDTPGAYTLELTVIAASPMRHAEIRFHAEPDERILSGVRSWQGQMAAGEIVRQVLVVQSALSGALTADVIGITVSDVHVHQVITFDDPTRHADPPSNLPISTLSAPVANPDGTTPQRVREMPGR